MSENNYIYYWNMNVNWNIQEDIIIIGTFNVKGFPIELFLNFYQLAKSGFSEDRFIEKYNPDSKEKRMLLMLVKKLIDLKVLKTSVESPEEVFNGQSRFINDTYPDDYFLNLENTEKFHEEKLTRFSSFSLSEHDIHLDDNLSNPILNKRRSTRSFDTAKLVTFKKFSSLLASVSNVNQKNTEIKYAFPSAGGLYPNNIYVFVKPQRHRIHFVLTTTTKSLFLLW